MCHFYRLSTSRQPQYPPSLPPPLPPFLHFPNPGLFFYASGLTISSLLPSKSCHQCLTSVALRFVKSFPKPRQILCERLWGQFYELQFSLEPHSQPDLPFTPQGSPWGTFEELPDSTLKPVLRVLPCLKFLGLRFLNFNSV